MTDTKTRTGAGATPLHQMDALRLADMVERGETTALAIVSDCLDRISEREGTVHAWSWVDRAGALAAARALDAGPRRGPFHGVPFGVKDVIDTADMPTAYGSPIYDGYRPGIDATAVTALRRAGGIVLGKTVTAEFAHRLPGPTSNPLDPSRTPGGSSSGSAAAVADAMVPLALGTQTTASTIRPASYCGVIGYRPTFGVISCAGVKPNSPSFDTIGIVARSLDDCALMRDILMEAAPHAVRMPDTAPRIGFCRTPFWSAVSPDYAAMLERAAGALSARGAKVREVTLDPIFSGVPKSHRVVSSYELARVMATERALHGELISAVMREGKIAEGLALGMTDYVQAQEHLEVARQASREIFGGHDIIAAPSAAGIAPLGLTTTGTAEFSAIWTALHLPSLTIPLPDRIDGMPLGIQLIGRRGSDRQLFDAARWIERCLATG